MNEWQICNLFTSGLSNYKETGLRSGKKATGAGVVANQSIDWRHTSQSKAWLDTSSTRDNREREVMVKRGVDVETEEGRMGRIGRTDGCPATGQRSTFNGWVDFISK